MPIPYDLANASATSPTVCGAFIARVISRPNRRKIECFLRFVYFDFMHAWPVARHRGVQVANQ